MIYCPFKPLDFTSNHCSLAEYLSYETTYETQTKLDTLSHDVALVVNSTDTQTVEAAASEQFETERAVAGGVSGGGKGHATGTICDTGQQLTLF